MPHLFSRASQLNLIHVDFGENISTSAEIFMIYSLMEIFIPWLKYLCLILNICTQGGGAGGVKEYSLYFPYTYVPPEFPSFLRGGGGYLYELLMALYLS